MNNDNITALQSAFIDRRKEYEDKFELMFSEFNQNMQNLEQHRFKIEKVVNTIHTNNEEASIGLEKLNGNLD